MTVREYAFRLSVTYRRHQNRSRAMRGIRLVVCAVAVLSWSSVFAAKNSSLNTGATAGLSSSEGEVSPINTAGQASSGTQVSKNNLPQRADKTQSGFGATGRQGRAGRLARAAERGGLSCTRRAATAGRAGADRPVVLQPVQPRGGRDVRIQPARWRVGQPVSRCTFRPAIWSRAS